jgi:hypothetical protein
MSTPNPNVPSPVPQPRADERYGCGWAWLWFFLFLVVIVAAGWGWGGWYNGWRGPGGWWEARQTPAPETRTPPTEHPAPAAARGGEFLGKTVTVTGRVDQVFSPHVFTLAAADGGRPLLVVNKDKTAPTVKKGEAAQITGSVEKYDADGLHRTTGADLAKVPSADIAGRPAIVASSLSAKSSASQATTDLARQHAAARGVLHLGSLEEFSLGSAAVRAPAVPWKWRWHCASDATAPAGAGSRSAA